LSKRFKDLQKIDRPREKLIKKGPSSLSTLELIAVILGSGIKGKDVYKVSKDITKKAEKDFDNLTVKNLIDIEGIGRAKACQIVSAIEFSKRFLIKSNGKIQSAEDVIRHIEDLRNKKQEHFVTLTLDGAGNLIEKRTVFIGTLNKSLVHPREIFADAISDRAASVIFVHNHPSGNVDPSEVDLAVTNRLKKAGDILGIEVIDHIIIGKDKYLSLKDKNLM